MTPHDIAFTARLGNELGPVALAVLYVVGAAGGEWTGKDVELCGLVGCSLRQLQKVRSDLVKVAVLTYSSGRRGEPRTYAVLPLPVVVMGAGTPGEEAPPPVPVPAATKRERKPLDSDPLFDAIVDFSYGGVRPAKGGRVAALAVEMHKAGLTAERFRAELPKVVALYASYRTTLDIDTVTKCWRWILSPPKTIDKPAGKSTPSAFEVAKKATANGNPFRPIPEVAG